MMMRLAHFLEPVRYRRGDVIAAQGTRPSHLLIFTRWSPLYLSNTISRSLSPPHVARSQSSHSAVRRIFSTSGEARLSVTLGKGLSADVALLDLGGGVINESALFDDSGCLGTFVATRRCRPRAWPGIGAFRLRCTHATPVLGKQ
jgi:hypothetical protein